MDKAKIRTEIITLINSIKEHSESLAGERHIPQLELELILNKIEKLYERSIIFNYLHSLPVESAPPITPVVPDLFSSAVAPVSPQQPEVAIPASVPVAPAPITPTSPKSESKEKTISGKFRKKPIESIKNTIGINEKFRYINDMFEGNGEEYHAAVTQLDNMPNLGEALIYIETLRQIYNWKEDHDSVVSFMDLVNRRF